jgi:hypothetical protein
MRAAALVPLVILATSCREDRRGVEQASAIYGCYTAPDAPSFTLSSAGMRVEGLSQAVPFRYDYEAVGYVVEVPLTANHSGGRFSFSRGDDHYYRMVASDTGPTMLVAFAPEGIEVTYKRSVATDCKS